MMDVVDFAVKVTAAVLRRLADGIDAAEKPPAAPTVVNVHISATDIDVALKRAVAQSKVAHRAIPGWRR